MPQMTETICWFAASGKACGLDRDIKLGRVLRPSLRTADFKPRTETIQRLTLFHCQQSCEFLGVFADLLCDGAAYVLSFLVRQL